MKKVIFLLVLFLICHQCYAEILLFDINVQENWSTSLAITELDFAVGYVINEVAPYSVLFWEASPEDIGTTLNIYESTDPDGFNTMSSLLTNGINDLFYYECSIGNAAYDFDLSGGTSDFIDFDITCFGLFVHDMVITENGETTVFSDVSFQAWGTPEPTTLILFALGGLILRRRR